MTMNSTVSCIPSTLNFACDVDGVHTEIPIPSSAWDFENETVWLTQAQLAELYACSHANLVGHIGNIYDDDELQESSTCRKFRQVQLEGNREVSREVKQYNLEMLIALGYRIRSKVATKFRQWATKHLKELMTKGHTELETQPQHQFAIPNTLPEALRAYADEVERREAAEKRAITAEAERDEAIRTKTQYQSNLAAQMSGRVGGLTSALNRVRTENDRLKADRFTVDDIYILMNTSDVSFTLKDPKAVIRDSLNLFSKEMGEPFPKVVIKQKEINGKVVDVSGYVYTRKAVQAYFEFVEANPLGWQARNRKMIMYGWLREKLTISA